MGNFYDKIIIGAGLYGLYAALVCSEKDEKVLVLEYDDQPFRRATFINQARIHMEYHYPRSYTTATKSANYYNQFLEDYGYCINESFDKIYAISRNFFARIPINFRNFVMMPIFPVNFGYIGVFKNDVIEGSELSNWD